MAAKQNGTSRNVPISKRSKNSRPKVISVKTGKTSQDGPTRTKLALPQKPSRANGASKPKEKAKAPASPSVVRNGLWAVPFDTETTGLVKPRSIKLNKQPEVIEFFGCLVDLKSGKIDREIDLLIRPTVEYPMTEYTIRATKTKLSNDLLADAPTFQNVANDIRIFLENAPLLIAHNLSFDKEMIEIEFERLKAPPVIWPLRQFCTVEQSIHLQGRRLSLTKLHQYLFDGEEFLDAHRARNDVMALTRCAVEMHKRELI